MPWLHDQLLPGSKCNDRRKIKASEGVIMNEQATAPMHLGEIKRKPVNLNDGDLIKLSQLKPGQQLPLVVEPAGPGLDLAKWAAGHREFIQENLLERGGILFRNFGVDTASGLEHTINAVSGESLEYRERSSPRSVVGGNIYTSTDYPADQSIFLHNENSYQRSWPMKIFFSCVVVASSGGETPIADCRKVMARLPKQLVDNFEKKRCMYVRNFGTEFGLSWKSVFQTSNKAEVEAHCRRNGLEAQWLEGDRLRTRAVRSAIVRHPVLEQPLWFNHVTFFHISTLGAVGEMLLEELGEENLPNNTYYGDGSQIEPEVLELLREAYRAETVSFPWQKGDVLVLDNMLTAHSRSPFKGARKVIVGMSEPTSELQ
jgi:alpha-ketoglutarate-dependent taurine dioxygenase